MSSLPARYLHTLFCPSAFIETQKIVVDLASIIRENPVTGGG
ncbi:MAG: hypothetical protein R3D26_12910 [Cyanobacteriota/Melainabacteria group bacterium]